MVLFSRFATALIPALLSMAFASCGGSESGGALSETEYLAQGNALCVEVNEEIAALSAEYGDQLDADQRVEFAERANAIGEGIFPRLFALEPPAERQDAHDLAQDLFAVFERMRDDLGAGEDISVEEMSIAAQTVQFQLITIWPQCRG